jgi:hypothetical protein
MKSILSLAGLAATGLLVVACSSSTAPGADPVAEQAAAVDTHGKTITLDYCNWLTHPRNTVCYQMPWPSPVPQPGPQDTPCPIDAKGNPAIPDGASAYLFRVAPDPKCKGATEKYRDGHEVFGGTADCAITKDGAYHEGSLWFDAAPNQALVHLYGVMDNVQASDVTASVNVTLPDSLTFGQVIVAFQVQNAQQVWTDVTKSYASTGQTTLKAHLDPNTSFRLEIRTGSFSGTKGVHLSNLSVFVPECQLDFSTNPPTCLP